MQAHITYTVVFEGRVRPGYNIERVKKRLQSSLQTNAEGIARLFTGVPVTVYKSTDRKTAQKYKEVFAAAGAVCNIEEVAYPNDVKAPQDSASSSSRIDTEASVPRVGASPFSPDTSIRHHYLATSSGGKMIVTNIESVPGKTVTEHYGLVSGSSIRAKHVGRDLMASLKNIVGGELKGYTQLLQESRKQAMDRMIEEARLMGANAIINVRFSTSSVAQGAAELYAYGTAVRVK